jgi:uncharacterized membrane-anchored protein
MTLIRWAIFIRSMKVTLVPSLILLGIGLALPTVVQAETSDEKFRRLFATIAWQDGPCTVSLGAVAELEVPQGFRFTGSQGAQIWDELSENPPNSRSAGVLVPNDLSWSLRFEFRDVGYVRDDEKDELNADLLLKQIREGTEQGNAYRRQQGWSALQVVGWERKPTYDSNSHNLQWAIRGSSTAGEVVNYNTRILGRGGFMSANLVIAPQEFGPTVPVVKGILTGFRFNSGQKYAEWRAGDPVAEYGLGALIVGGGAAIAAKTGFLSKIAAFFVKIWKPVALAVVAFFAWFKRKSFSGNSSSSS